MADIISAASKAAQPGPAEIVTSEANGNLATFVAGVSRNKKSSNRDRSTRGGSDRSAIVPTTAGERK